MDDRPIGVFDSGLGGLTIVRALGDLLPDEHLLYFGDTGRFPYGSKPPELLRRYSTEIVDLLVDHDVKMVVVACNSASSAALSHLRERYTVPIVGVIEPGVRAALDVTRGKIGVIGTEATISSGAYERVFAESRADVEVVTQACPGFVELVESGDVASTQSYGVVAPKLAPLRVAGIDTVILGCTHYPLLGRVISDVLGRDVVLVSSAEETAFEVRTLLERTGLGRRPGQGPAERILLTSGDEDRFRTLGDRFAGSAMGPVRGWDWPPGSAQPQMDDVASAATGAS
ncbi:MAG: glutamate racemase [Actinobacteria bacterium]|nr:glutamate racemase [Actinomycetota bacterium]